MNHYISKQKFCKCTKTHSYCTERNGHHWLIIRVDDVRNLKKGKSKHIARHPVVGCSIWYQKKTPKKLSTCHITRWCRFRWLFSIKWGWNITVPPSRVFVQAGKHFTPIQHTSVKKWIKKTSQADINWRLPQQLTPLRPRAWWEGVWPLLPRPAAGSWWPVEKNDCSREDLVRRSGTMTLCEPQPARRAAPQRQPFSISCQTEHCCF